MTVEEKCHAIHEMLEVFQSRSLDQRLYAPVVTLGQATLQEYRRANASGSVKRIAASTVTLKQFYTEKVERFFEVRIISKHYARLYLRKGMLNEDIREILADRKGNFNKRLKDNEEEK